MKRLDRPSGSRRTAPAAALLLALVLAGCEGGTIVVRGEAPIPAPAPPRPRVVTPPPPPPVQAMWVKEIRADHVRARVIYAKKVEAAYVQVGQVVYVPEREAKGWGRGEKLRAALVQSDEIYAREIKARVVEAAVLYVHELERDDDD